MQPAVSLFRLDGRVAVVTGGSRGIGLESARALREHGAEVVIVSLSIDRGREVADELSATFIPGDVSKSDQVARVAQDVLTRFGTIDIAVNNAGIAASIACEDCSDEEWYRIMRVNLDGLFFCCREFGKVMLQRGEGSIINMASISGVVSNVPQPQAPYNTSKAAVIHLTKCLAGEWANRGVRVNSVSPGYVLTDMSRGGVENPEWSPFWNGFTPMERIGQASEVAAAVLYLASSASSFVTGSNLIVDGGYTCW